MAADLSVIAVHLTTVLMRARSAGLDERALLADLDFAPDELENYVAPVPLPVFATVLERCEAATDDKLFAAQAGLATSGDEYAIGRYAFTAHATVRDSVQASIQMWEMMGNPLHARFEEDAAGGETRFSYARDSAAGVGTYVELLQTLLLAAIRIGCGVNVTPERVEFAHVPRDEPAGYEELFGAPVSFEAPAALVRFSAAVLDLPNLTPDAQLARLAHADVLRSSRAHYTDGMDVVGLVQATLNAADTPADWRLETVSERHRVAIRTLQYHLQQSGTNFQALADAARRSKATRLLRDGLPLDEITFRLGYGDTSSFRKAFIRWFAAAPGEWRRRLIEDGGAD